MATAESNVARNIRNVVEKFEDTLKVACDQLTGDLPVLENNEFNSDIFWNNFGAATKLVSHEATKFCMAFDSGGMSSTEECQCLVNKVESSCLALLSVFFKLPKSRGKILHKEITSYVLKILQGMKNLCSAVRNQSNQLQNVGDIWAQCETIEHLPKDNRDAVMALCQEQCDMVHDAIQELTMAIEEESEAELSFIDPLPNGIRLPAVQNWTTSDRNILFPCSGLLKASKACIKKCLSAISQRGNGNDVGCINELDLVAEIVQSSSAVADDFVLSIYPPMDHSLVCQQAALIKDTSKQLLSTVKNSHFCAATDEVWIEFLGKAIDHNWVRINDLVLAD